MRDFVNTMIMIAVTCAAAFAITLLVAKIAGL
jgi:hypothetical protein